MYDFVGVIGTQQLTDGGASIMEAVARLKADIPTTISSSIRNNNVAVTKEDVFFSLNKW